MRVNLCPCMRLETGVKVIAIIDVVGSIYFIFSFSYEIVKLDELYKETNSVGIENSVLEIRTTVKSLRIFQILIFIIHVFLCLGLYWGVMKKNAEMCWAWIGFTSTTVLIAIIDLIFVVSKYTPMYFGYGYIETIIHILFQPYAIFVVSAFIGKLRQIWQQEVDTELVMRGSNPFPVRHGGDQGKPPAQSQTKIQFHPES
ncbi:unnamed protein product [Orchesella dallaii]|uniref:Uncharacterized protein n=1 Tax=Orchesella dallaii TaxID=48710 RepID=A0ABP1QKX8_9HEXA